jgi:hypothetical protein
MSAFPKVELCAFRSTKSSRLHSAFRSKNRVRFWNAEPHAFRSTEPCHSGAPTRAYSGPLSRARSGVLNCALLGLDPTQVLSRAHWR